MSASRDGSSWTTNVVGDVSVLTFDRPPLGTIRHQDVESLERALIDASARGQRAVVLTGTGDVFVRHADLDDLAAMAVGAETTGDPGAWIRVLRLLDKGPFVTVAAINGQAWGGGLEIALSCNLRLMDVEATVAFPEVALGIIPGVAAHRAMALLPEGRLLDLLMTGRVLSAAQACEWGIVTRVVDAGTVLKAALSLCELVLRYPESAVLAARNLVISGRDSSERERRVSQSDAWARLASEPGTVGLVLSAQRRYLEGQDSKGALGISVNQINLEVASHGLR